MLLELQRSGLQIGFQIMRLASTHHMKFHVAAILLASTNAACGSKSKHGESSSDFNTSNAAAAAVAVDVTIDESEKISLSLLLERMAADPTSDFLWSLAQCQCAPTYELLWLQENLTKPGVLPQALVPDIRSSIRADENLQKLIELDGSLGGLATKLFANDDKIEAGIRQGIAEKMTTIPGISPGFDQQLNFRFDAFIPLRTGNLAIKPANTFALEEQTGSWQLVLQQDNLWDESTSLGTNDQSVRLFHTLKLLTEWKYLFGLSAGAGNPGVNLGGLTVASDGSDGLALRSFDARSTPEGAPVRVISGELSVTYPDTSVLNLSLNGGEAWIRSNGPIALREQAHLWTNAALAFHRLRPSQHRKKALFSDNSPLAGDAYMLPLAFMPGLEGVLKQLVDESTRSIRSALAIGESEPSGSKMQPASLRDLSASFQGLAAWGEELSSVADLPKDTPALNTLEAAPEKLADVIRLFVQFSLSVKTRAVSTPFGEGLALIEGDAESENEVDLSSAAEFLASLIIAEDELQPSPFLSDNIDGICSWFVPYAAASLQDSNSGKVSAEAIVWTMDALRRFSQKKTQSSNPVLLSAASVLMKDLEAVIQDWGNRAR